MHRRQKRISKLQRIARALRASDPDIIEIVLFGSSVYAPRLAHDMDIMVTTRAKKPDELYWDATANVADKNVDVLVREPGQPISPTMALAIVAFSRSLWGNGLTRKEAKQFMPIPTYAEARELLTEADEYLALASKAHTESSRDHRFRVTFDTLFHAARYAAMTFLVTDETRPAPRMGGEGGLPQRLPRPFNSQFREFIGTLHVRFSYDGLYPKDQVEETYRAWRARVGAFIEQLATRTQPSG